VPKPTDERIASALAHGARVTDVSVLIEDMQAEIAAASAEADRMDAVSVAVETAEPDADAAADEAAKERRRATRMSAKLALVKERLQELEDSNRRKAAEAAYSAAMKRRDELADDIRKQWPELTDGMIALFERIKASDAECEKIGACYGKPKLFSAESVARSCSPIFTAPGTLIPRMIDTVLTCLDASDPWNVQYGVWPKRPTIL
jgi:hypothetical protein